jgi:hypothetical protein
MRTAARYLAAWSLIVACHPPVQLAPTPSAAVSAASAPAQLQWRVEQASSDLDHVHVTLVVDGRPYQLGAMDVRAGGEAASAPARCESSAEQADVSQLSCCATPMFEYFRATANDGVLRVTHVRGVDGASDQTETEVLRKPVAGSVFQLAPAAGNVAWIAITDDC